MKPFAALVWKDFQSMKWFLLFLFVTIPAAAAVSEAGIILWDAGIADISRPFFLRAYDYSHAYGFILTVLLVYAINIEVNSSTVHSALSLPVRRFLIMLSKVVIIASAAFTIAFLSLTIEWFVSRFFPYYELSSKSYSFIHGLDYFKHGIEFPMRSYGEGFITDYLYWALHLLLFPGIVCIAQGVTAMVKRNRFAAWAMTFFIVLFLFSLYSGWCQEKFMYHTPAWVYMLDTEAGIVFLLIGLLLFDRFSEV